MPEFPHMRETAFPHYENVDVYKYRNEFDYNRYDSAQMHIMLCSVPWDMGEAHIGNRTISGIGNVVWFETEERRDAWFDAIPDSQCYRFDTKYKELHRDNMIAVPVPFDIASNFNYLVVEYEPFANADSMIQYESLGGLKKWFWFIREVEFVSPNTTILHLMNDAFQTFMYRMHFAGMILERGHAPMLAIDADTYLANPIENNAGLLAEDVNFGDEPVRVANSVDHVFNSDTWACVATTGNPTSNWGTKAAETWHTPALASYTVDGVPDTRIFAMDVSNLNTFLSTMQSDIPQFAKTIKGVFFAPKELITTGNEFTFCNTACHWVSTSNVKLNLTQVQKAQFGYPARYAKLAKLYTWPYACLEITDESGNSEIVRIENTSGTLDISASMNLAFPALSIQAHILGVGGNEKVLSFSNITNRSLRIGGKWYETLHEWDVPIFGVYQSATVHNDYNEFFDRKQARLALENTYDSSIASATTNYENTIADALANRDNALDSADVQHVNASRSAYCLRDNAALQVAANTAIKDACNAAAYGTGSTAEANITANNAQVAQANNFINNTTNSQIDATLQSASVSAGAGLLTSGISAIASAATGNPGGAIASLAGGVVSAGAATAQAHIASNLTATQASASTSQNDQKRITSNNLTSELASIHTSLETTNNTTKNNLITASTGNTVYMQNQNAKDSEIVVKGGTAESGVTYTGTAPRTYATSTDNAQRTRTTDNANAARTKNTAEGAITNRLSQRALDAPQEFGQFANVGKATTKPMALIANVLTQSASAIRQTGDEFLRYGYYYNAQWNFNGNWNLGKYFTYWKLADFWVKGLNIPDMYVDKLRFFLYGGVTVWRNPEDIGNRTIYENMEV